MKSSVVSRWSFFEKLETKDEKRKGCRCRPDPEILRDGGGLSWQRQHFKYLIYLTTNLYYAKHQYLSGELYSRLLDF